MEQHAHEVRVAAGRLHRLIGDSFEALGIDAADANAVADALVYANLRGIDSHGFNRVPLYLRRVHAGLAGGSEQIAVVARSRALCRLDARHALGPAAGVRAVDLALEMAGEHGVGVTAVGNATHFGAAGFYAMRACTRGCISIVLSNAFARMAPHGATEPFLGSNPMAIAIPLGERDPFLLDMSSTVLAQGKIRRAQASGTPIEPGAALDASGRPTTDPASALQGIMLPVGAHKGSGLALAITLLVAILGGADFDDEVASVYGDFTRAQNLGQLFVVIDPEHVAERELVQRRLAHLVDRFHALHPQDGLPGPRYPGEGAAERERERRRLGIPIERGELRQFHDACTELGLVAMAEQVTSLLDAGAGADTAALGAVEPDDDVRNVVSQ